MTKLHPGEGSSPELVKLVCPHCHSGDSLSTVESLQGSAYGAAYVELESGEREFAHEGWTEISWDVSDSIAIECRNCGWTQKAPAGYPALEELVLDPESDAAQLRLEVGDASASDV